MGPMGSMMGGSLGTFGWPVLVLPVVLFALVLGAVTFAFLTARGGSEPRRQASPEETLRDRYSRGEIGRQQYRDALEDILKDLYVRGELTLDEYEANSVHSWTLLSRGTSEVPSKPKGQTLHADARAQTERWRPCSLGMSLR